MEIQKAISLDKKPARLAQLGELYARLGRRQEALQMIREMQRMSVQQYVNPAEIALVYSRLGQNDQAFAWLEKAGRAEGPNSLNLSDRGFDNLRSDPRFKIMEARLKPNQSCPAF
jgi:tetratricopeptide (TPR) repeat protein